MMATALLSVQRNSLLAEIISATQDNAMKLILYIRATTRRTVAQQIEATKRKGIALTVIEGEQGRTYDTAIKVGKPGNGILLDSLETLGRKITTRIARLEAAAAKGLHIVIAEDESTHAPQQIPSLIAGLRSGVKRERPPRVAHNRIGETGREAAFRYWQDHGIDNHAVERLAGVSYASMRRWWQKDYPRPLQRPGRKRNS